MIASSNLSPPTRTEPEYTMPPSEITPTSVVPPPMSTTMEPVASATGRSAPLDLGRAAGHADNDARAGREELVVVDLLDELFEHLLGDGEVGDHPVLHRPDGDDVAGGLAKHLLRFLADRLDRLLAVRPCLLPDCHHRGFIEH